MGILDVPFKPSKLLPANVPTSRTGVYDATTSLYIPTTSALQKFRRAQSGRATSSLLNILCLGDSKTLGFGVTGGTLNAYPNVLRTQLTANGYPVVGTGLVLARSYELDTRYSASAGWISGQTWMQTSTSGASVTFTSDVPGTVIEVYYYNNSGGFNVAVDGASAVTVSPNNTATLGKYTVSGLTNANHAITLTTTSSSNVYLIGMSIRPTSGIVIHNGGYNGMTTAGYAATGFPSAGFNQLGAVPTPDIYASC